MLITVLLTLHQHILYNINILYYIIKNLQNNVASCTYIEYWKMYFSIFTFNSKDRKSLHRKSAQNRLPKSLHLPPNIEQ